MGDYERMQYEIEDDEPEFTLADQVRLFIRLNTMLWVWQDRIAKLRGWYLHIFLWDVRRFIQRIRDPKGYAEWRNSEPPF